MRVVFLTGNIGTGIPEILKTFEKHRIPVLDVDAIALDLVSDVISIPSQNVLKLCGCKILNPSGTVDQCELSKALFFRSEQKKTIFDILFHLQRKLLIKLFTLWILRKKTVIISMTHFFEYYSTCFYSDLITVNSSYEKQLQRVMEDMKVSAEEASQRIKTQIPIDFKCSMSTIVINNEGNADENEKNVSEVINKWKNEPRKISRTILDPLFIVFIVFLIIFFFY